MILVSLVIPNYNGENKLGIFFKSLLKQNFPLEKTEIIIGDDGSTDKSLEIINNFKNKGIPIIIRRNEKNKGRSSALNLALKECRGEIVIICDNDFELVPDFITEHLKSHRNIKTAIVVGSLKNKYSQKTLFMEFLDWIQHRHNRFCEDHAQSLPFIYFRANSSFKREEFENIQLFNERFRDWGYEDMEFGYRLVQKGFRMVYNPNALCRHHTSETNFSFRCSRNYNSGKNKALFLSLFPEALYDLYRFKTGSGNLSVRLNYFFRYLVCKFIIKNPLISEKIFLRSLYHSAKLLEKFNSRFLLFVCYHVVSGLFLEISYFKNISQMKKIR